MFLQRTQQAIAESEDHIAKTGVAGTAIESFLTQHILILLSSEMQEEIYSVLEEKSRQLNQQDLREFVANAGKACVRGVKKEAIAGFLGHFGGSYKQDFNSALSSKEKEVTVYGNAITNRDSVAHRGGAQVTFNEIKSAVESAKLILSSVRTVLQVDADESSKATGDGI